jgi:hypothetical protein
MEFNRSEFGAARINRGRNEEGFVMESKVGRTSLIALMVIAGLCMLSSAGCSIFRATGEAVESVGQGAGTAVKGTGRAIVHGADDTEDEINRATR